MKKLREKIGSFFKSEKAIKDSLNLVISLIIIISVGMLIYNMTVTPKENGQVIPDRESQTIDEENLYYEDEKRFSDILSQIKGVGDTKVMITYYNEEVQKKSENGSDVKGVIVVAEGAGNTVVKNDILCAVQAVFDIPANRITVLESK